MNIHNWVYSSDTFILRDRTLFSKIWLYRWIHILPTVWIGLLCAISNMCGLYWRTLHGYRFCILFRSLWNPVDGIPALCLQCCQVEFSICCHAPRRCFKQQGWKWCKVFWIRVYSQERRFLEALCFLTDVLQILTDLSLALQRDDVLIRGHCRVKCCPSYTRNLEESEGCHIQRASEWYWPQCPPKCYSHSQFISDEMMCLAIGWPTQIPASLYPLHLGRKKTQGTGPNKICHMRVLWYAFILGWLHLFHGASLCSPQIHSLQRVFHIWCKKSPSYPTEIWLIVATMNCYAWSCTSLLPFVTTREKRSSKNEAVSMQRWPDISVVERAALVC